MGFCPEIASKSLKDGKTRTGKITGGRKWVTRQTEQSPLVEKYEEDDVKKEEMKSFRNQSIIGLLSLVILTLLVF